LYQAEFKTREKLLEIEYRLAELAEKLEAKPDK
jgi:BMFP domain-containing protein YqiC